MKLKPLALGLSLGTVWGTALFLMTLISHFTGYAGAFLEAIPGSIYPGYGVSPAGSIAGFIYGFVDFLAVGMIIGWLYNRLSGLR